MCVSNTIIYMLATWFHSSGVILPSFAQFLLKFSILFGNIIEETKIMEFKFSTASFLAKLPWRSGSDVDPFK